MSAKPKKKNNTGQVFALALSLALGVTVGIIASKFLFADAPADTPFGMILIRTGLHILAAAAAIFLQIIIHEAGHLVCGLLSGYRFSSFRIGSFMWVRENTKLTCKRLSIAGTGGQCLMIPPEAPDEQVPFVLYNLGGGFANILSGVLSFGVYWLLRGIPYISVFLLMAALFGLVFALLNMIPLYMGTVTNDGYNALAFAKDKTALRSFVVQLNVVAQTSRGMRLKDMPADWFDVPPYAEVKNGMTAAHALLACNRLFDAHSFAEADRMAVQLLDTDTLVGLHRHLLLCDRIFYELITQNRPAALADMLDKPQQNFTKAMRKFPSVLRTSYTYALRAEADAAKAAAILAQFEKVARSYPYQSDIESERELIVIAGLDTTPAAPPLQGGE